MSEQPSDAGRPADPAAGWWWTPARFSNSCADCGELSPAGALVAYNHTLRSSVCEVCGEKYAPQTSRAARAAPRPKAKRSKPRKPKPTMYRRLATLSGSVPYVDSGWTDAEWQTITAAMAKNVRAT